MRNLLFFLIPFSVFAFLANTFEIQVQTGYSTGNSTISIDYQSNGESKLKCKNAQQMILGLQGSFHPLQKLQLQAGIYGDIFTKKGDCKSLDRNQQNMTFDLESKAQAHILGINASLSYFLFNWLKPQIGYLFLKETYYLTNGKQTSPFYMPLDDLDNKYAMYWNGLDVGLQGTIPLVSSLYFSYQASVLGLFYVGKGDWNLRNISYKDDAKGWGSHLDAMLSYRLTKSFCINALIDYLYLHASSGDTKNNSPYNIGESSINHVTTHRIQALASLSVNF